MSDIYLTLLNIALYIDNILIYTALINGQILWKKFSKLKNEIKQMWIRQELNVDQIVDESKGSDKVYGGCLGYGPGEVHPDSHRAGRDGRRTPSAS